MMAIILLASVTGFGQSANKLSIHGTSNLHDWETICTEVQISGKVQMENGALTGVDQLTVRVPVSKIKSEKGKTMDGKTHESLKSNKNPHITFNASRVQVNGQDVTATGPLSIAGQTRTVTVKGKWRAISANEIEVKGSHAMKMTDFGISPPTALLGTMKTGDGITLQFTVRVKG